MRLSAARAAIIKSNASQRALDRCDMIPHRKFHSNYKARTGPIVRATSGRKQSHPEVEALSFFPVLKPPSIFRE